MIWKSISRKEGHYDKGKILDRALENLLSLGLGIPALIYVVVAFSTSVWFTRGGLIGLSVIGVLY